MSRHWHILRCQGIGMEHSLHHKARLSCDESTGLGAKELPKTEMVRASFFHCPHKSLCSLLLFQDIFLFIIWGFHTMHIDRTHFPFFPCPSSHPCYLPKYTKPSFYCLYTHWNMVKLPVASHLNITESFLYFPTISFCSKGLYSWVYNYWLKSLHFEELVQYPYATEKELLGLYPIFKYIVLIYLKKIKFEVIMTSVMWEKNMLKLWPGII